MYLQPSSIVIINSTIVINMLAKYSLEFRNNKNYEKIFNIFKQLNIDNLFKEIWIPD